MEESVRDMLDRLERVLVDKIEALRGELGPLEAELSQVRKAKAAIGASEDQARTPMSFAPVDDGLTDTSAYRGMTMKQLTIKALAEHFPNGATANELMEFFARAWGRKDIVRESFSPQLSRLKREGKIKLQGKVWSLASDEAPKENEPPTGGSEAGEGSTSPDPAEKPGYQFRLPAADPAPHSGGEGG